MSNLFASIFTSSITVAGFFICLATALVLGAGISLTFMFRSNTTKSFAATLALLPAIVSVIILMVNGNLGAGVAVAGTFSLVRFRSAPGTAREIGAIFLSMAVGLACGMGYIAFGVIFAVILCAADLFYNSVGFGDTKKGRTDRTLRILIPEDLEYNGMFDDLFQQYTTEANLTQIKTTNLGSMNRLTYDIKLKEPGTEKAFIDELRCRNGNLEIQLGLRETAESAL